MFSTPIARRSAGVGIASQNEFMSRGIGPGATMTKTAATQVVPVPIPTNRARASPFVRIISPFGDSVGLFHSQRIPD
jgi:hypothetical protein